MKIFNPLDKFITLHDGSRVSKKFYETVKQHVEDRYKYHQCSHIPDYPGTNRAMSARIRSNKDVPVIIAF